MLERINTKKKLASLNIIPPSEVGCSLCSLEPEDISHLFLFCPFSMEIWAWWWDLWNLSWVWPKSLNLALSQWNYPRKEKLFKKIWLAAFIVIIWSIWRERNERIFNKKESSVSEIKNLILVRLCWWMKPWNLSFPYTIEEVIRIPQCLLWGSAVPRRSKTSHLPPLIQLRSNPPDPCLKWMVGFTPFSPKEGARAGGIYGGFLRHELGVVLCSFSCPFPPMGINEVAVIAIHRALQISLSVQNLKDREISIFSESRQAISWCLNLSSGPTNLSFLLNFIRSSCKKLPLLKFDYLSSCSSQVKQNAIGEIYVFSDVVRWKKSPI